MRELLLESKEIIDKAVADYKPYATVLMLSGGDDSRLTQEVLRELGIRPDFIIHGVTGTGIKQTTDFVRKIAATTDSKYVEADAGDAYIDYLLRKGFFGKGVSAHKFSYHVLKAIFFRKAVSHHIRNGKRNRKVLFFNGVRVDESDNRADKLGDNPYNIDPAAKSNIWVNVVHWWTTKQRDQYLSGNSCERSPVSICLGRSGECMCGTMQSGADRMLASEFYPEWGEWIDELDKFITKKFGWGWGMSASKKMIQDTKDVSDFMPMCIGCKTKWHRQVDDSNNNLKA